MENMADMEPALRMLLATLTEQERDALERACTGADYPALARDLGINRWTFKSRVRRAQAKIGVSTRLEAMVLLRAGEISARVLTPGAAARFGLFEREAQVLALICRGLRRPTIARELVVEEGTVAAHINSICAKVGAHNCVEIIVRMISAADPSGEPAEARATATAP